MCLDQRWHDLAQELLRDLLRIDTTNPPGNELAACERIAETLVEADIEPKLHRVAPGRANLTARVRGTTPLPPLMLSSHLDVVPADPDGWTHPPFSATEADGCIWGRGAVDMKHMAALSAVVLARLRAEKVPLRRDVILACVADEETGGKLGAQWLVDNAPDDVLAGVALGEIGGMSLRLAGRRMYPVQVAEKGLAWLRLTARGEGGHGSIPNRSSAVVALARAVETLGRRPLPTHITPPVKAFAAAALDGVRGGLRVFGPLLLGDGMVSALLRLAGDSPAGRAIGAMVANTAQPTCLRAGVATNVLPSEAVAEVDGRTLPGQNTADLVREVRALIGDEIEVEVTAEAPPVEAPLDHPILDTIRAVLRERDPGGAMVPSLTPGFTDAKAWSKLGIACFGFTPVRFPDDFPVQYSTLFHAKDERIPIDGFHFGLDALGDVVERWAAREAGQ